MVRSINSILLLALFPLLAGAQTVPLTKADSALFQRVFKGYTATFAMYNENTRMPLIWNEKEAYTSYSPCSTFKIFNSMAAIDAGALRNEDDTIRWNGEEMSFKTWERDHTLRSAITYSVVWFYMEVARRIGEEQMQRYLDLISYGNSDMSGGLTRFWLESSLKISAAEQLAFLRRIPSYSLPFSRRAIDILKDILILEKTDTYTFRGKTGSGRFEDGKGQGWFVGWVERDENRFYFALHILGDAESNGPKAKELCIDILKAKGLLTNESQDK